MRANRTAALGGAGRQALGQTENKGVPPAPAAIWRRLESGYTPWKKSGPAHSLIALNGGK